MKKEKWNKTVMMLALLPLALSCNHGTKDEPDPVFGDSELVMNVPSVEFADGSHSKSKSSDEDVVTKSSMDETGNGLKFLWSNGDAVAVGSEDGVGKWTLKDGAKSSNASFQGTVPAPGTGCTAFYPYQSYSDPSPELDFRPAPISSNGSKSGLSAPLYASATVNQSGGIRFDAKHLSSFASFGLSVPVNAQLSSLSLIPAYDELPVAARLDMSDGSLSTVSSVPVLRTGLTGITASSKNRELNAWLSLCPHDYSEQTVAAVVEDEFNGLYSISLPGKNLQPGKAYGWEGGLIKYTNDNEAPLTILTDLSDASALQRNISLLGVPYGQFSGITHVEGNRYAVVHDQARGGGIYFLDLGFDSQGNVISASQTIPEATRSGAASRDAEGIIYIPSSKTFFTCGETYQDILEYDYEGRATGRRLAVPEDMASASLTQNNQGFESLAYNARTGLIWTTTEAPLEKDKDVFNEQGRLIRLQSFGTDLSAGKRYLYLIDGPEVENQINSATYGYGVSDMLALDDGKLIVMEREVYVNMSSLNVWSKVRLYLVDPVNDNAGILSKSLLASFKTSTGALADYEGMCEGPVLPDGTKTILLICDSAGGKSYSGFHLSDYILTVAYK